MHQSTPNVLHRFFSGLAENTFHTRLGVVDPPLVDYISDLLIRFTRTEAIQRFRDVRGRTILEVVQMMAEAEQRVGEARREIHRHIGDLTLFWTGVYPESLKKHESDDRTTQMIHYCEHGKRAYWIASTIDEEKGTSASSEVLQRLSEQFELCAYGLQEVRREWERRNEDGEAPPSFLIN